jgi:hypothetical protein
VADLAGWFTRIGGDPGDSEEMREKKALLVLLAVLILPVSLVWGSLYLGFGQPVGVVPFVRRSPDLRPGEKAVVGYVLAPAT